MKVRNINDGEYAISIESFPIIESIFVGSPDKKYRLSIGVDRINLAKEMISELILNKSNNFAKPFPIGHIGKYKFNGKILF